MMSYPEESQNLDPSSFHLVISCAKNNPLLLLSTKASLLLRQLLCKRIFIRHSSSVDSSAKDLRKHSSSAALLEDFIFTDTLLQELQFSNRNLHSSSFFFTNSCTMKNLKPFMVILGVQPEFLPQAHEATMPSSMFSRLPSPTSEQKKAEKNTENRESLRMHHHPHEESSHYSLSCV
jgi:hypothetical protein